MVLVCGCTMSNNGITFGELLDKRNNSLKTILVLLEQENIVLNEKLKKNGRNTFKKLSSILHFSKKLEIQLTAHRLTLWIGCEAVVEIACQV